MIKDSAIPVKGKNEPWTAKQIAITLDWLASHGMPETMADIRLYIDDLEARNAALLAACKAFLGRYHNHMVNANLLFRDVAELATAAILKAEGKAVPNVAEATVTITEADVRTDCLPNQERAD